MARPLAFAVHHLNPWGGHDRSVLEIAKHLSESDSVEVYSYAIDGTDWRPQKFVKIRPFFRRPAIALFSYFHLASLYYFIIKPFLTFKRRPLVHSTGTCSLIIDVVQVQFVNAAWRSTLRNLSGEVYQLPGSRHGSSLRRGLMKFYHSTLLAYNAWVEKRLYNNSKTYIAISRVVKQELQDHFNIDEKQIHIIHHGVDSKVFRSSPETKAQMRRQLNLSDDETVVLFVGEFERKGLAVSIEALAKCPRDRKWRLLVVGSGQRQGFIDQANRLGIRDRVEFLGHRRDVQEIYKASDIFLLPTLYEPFGLVILEAMASGLACVVSKCAGGSELIKNGSSGLLIENPGDALEIQKYLTDLIVDSELRKQMSIQACKVAETRSWSQVAKEYRQVLAPMSGGSL